MADAVLAGKPWHGCSSASKRWLLLFRAAGTPLAAGKLLPEELCLYQGCHSIVIPVKAAAAPVM